MIAAAMAKINTAPDARSLVRLMASSYSWVTRSAKASIAELTASAASTIPMANITAIHSDMLIPKKKPATTTHTAANQ